MRIWVLCAIGLAASAVAGELASFDVVRPVLEAMKDQLPAELSRVDEASWNAWSRAQNAEIRKRLEQGEVDSMVNLLLYGTSFTKQPRIEIESLAEASRAGTLRARVDDLVRGLGSPGGNERLVVLRSLIQRQGLNPDEPRTGVFILENLQRVLQENRKFGERLKEAPTEPAFRDRGVSLDASIAPNFVIDQALSDLKKRGVLAEGLVMRVAVVGPGLDFIDKQSGYDYYPQQTLQPFAVHDSLLRLGLARNNATVTVFDISSRVLEHLERARDRARQRRGYVVQLPRDARQSWTPAAVDYWRAFGDRVGRTVAPIAAPAGLETRAVEIRAEVVLASEPVDLNVVLERISLPAPERFDLIVATNVFVYYDRLGQALALQNLSTLLKPGGILLTNDELPELAEVPVRKAGNTAVRFSDKYGEPVFWYRRE